jgi:drug/metabolite transporter (DMT)-like permease
VKLIPHIGIRPKTNLRLAIPAVLVASLFNALMGMIVKISSSSLSTSSMITWRNLINLMFILPWLLWIPPRGHLIEKVKTHQIGMHLIRACSGLTSVFLYFYSLKYLLISDATLLFNTFPIFIPIVAYLWRRTRTPPMMWWGIGIAFLGIVLTLHPGSGVVQMASLCAIASGMLGAVSYTAIRYSHYTEPSRRTMFYYAFIAFIIAGLVSLIDFSGNWMQLNPQKLWLLLALGVTGMVNQTCLIQALKHAPARLMSCFMYSSVIFAMMIDWWLWGNSLSLLSYLGFALILLGAIWIFLFYPKEAPSKKV